LKAGALQLVYGGGFTHFWWGVRRLAKMENTFRKKPLWKRLLIVYPLWIINKIGNFFRRLFGLKEHFPFIPDWEVDKDGFTNN
jgi:hypothetical protein